MTSAPSATCGSRVKGLSRFGFFHGVDLEARRGEILGICGLSGAGRTELAKVLAGLDRADEGSIELDGKRRARIIHGGRSCEQGISYLTEDRKTEGLAIRLPVDDNILSAIVDRLSRVAVYSKARGKPAVDRLIRELSIYPPDPFPPCRQPLGRQPAEGPPRQVARERAQGAHPR